MSVKASLCVNWYFHAWVSMSEWVIMCICAFITTKISELHLDIFRSLKYIIIETHNFLMYSTNLKMKSYIQYSQLDISN